MTKSEGVLARLLEHLQVFLPVIGRKNRDEGTFIVPSSCCNMLLGIDHFPVAGFVGSDPNKQAFLPQGTD